VPGELDGALAGVRVGPVLRPTVLLAFESFRPPSRSRRLARVRDSELPRRWLVHVFREVQPELFCAIRFLNKSDLGPGN